MSNQQFEVLVGDAAQGSYATREEADKAAATQRSTSPGKTVTVREKGAAANAAPGQAPPVAQQGHADRQPR